MAVTEHTDLPQGSAAADTQTEFSPSESFMKRRRARSIMIAAILFGMVALFYLVTLVKLGPGVLDRPL